ncbi:MAG: GDP-mannose 4,6-dehydratase [Calditrichia bacterium]
MNIAITGAAGFIGSHLCEALLKRGDTVIGMDNFDPFYSEKIKRRNIQNILHHENFHFYEDNILDLSRLQEILSAHPITHIVHLAAKAGVRPSIQYPLLYQKYNVEGTANMLEMCRKLHIENFIFASSSSVYGNNKKIPFAETDNVDFPISPYAATKKAGELLCYTYHHLFGLNIFALRFFTVYGPRQRPEMAIHKFTRAIDQNQPVEVYGFGKPQRDFTFIDDIIQGVVRAIDRVKDFEIINLGESQTISVNQLIALIEKSLGKKATKIEMPMQPGDVERTFADITRAKEFLDYQPQTPIEKGIEVFVRWYLENKST